MTRYAETSSIPKITVAASIRPEVRRRIREVAARINWTPSRVIDFMLGALLGVEPADDAPGEVSDLVMGIIGASTLYRVAMEHPDRLVAIVEAIQAQSDQWRAGQVTPE